MKPRKKLLIWLMSNFVWIFAACNLAQAQTLAFPGAEGYGRFSTGGRGGQVIEVTNLNDSGSGSLRAALTASGPRTVVFRVSGTIELADRIKITKPNLTIAGQTAPGDGVTVKGMLDFRTNNVIVRYLRVRPGPNAVPNPDALDAIQITSPANTIILDHVSLSWATDEVFSVWGKCYDITVQWSIISESLNCPTPRHSKGCHGKGVLVGGGADNLSFHHNLLAHHVDRNPNLKSGDIDMVNNLIYNYGNYTNLRGEGGVLKANVVGNYYKPGGNTQNKKPVRLWGDDNYTSQSGVYLEGNIHPTKRPNNSLPETDIRFLTKGPPDILVVTTAYNHPQVTTTDAFQALIDVPEDVGANFPVRDPVDTRIINDVLNGTGQKIDMPSEVGGYPVHTTGNPPVDSDQDGMPNSWELSVGLNPDDPSDGNGDSDGDGYTNLEDYLNSLTQLAIDQDPPLPPSNLRFQ